MWGSFFPLFCASVRNPSTELSQILSTTNVEIYHKFIHMFSKQVMSKTVSFTNKYSTNELFLGEETRIIPSNFFLVLNGHNFEPREYIFCPFHNLNYHLPSCITVCCLPPPIALDPQYFYLHFRNITNNWAVAFQYSLSVSPTPSKT